MNRALSLTIYFHFLSLLSISAQQEYQQKTYTTASIQGQKISIDGNITDHVWNKVDWATDFTVQQPNNGDTPKEITKFKVLYDDEHLYLAFRCYVSDVSKIEKRLSRRDGFEGDWIEFNIDSYDDNNTAYSFTLTAANVLGDEFITDNGSNWDSNWNPIWYGKSQADEEGWTAEMKIPISQLRFGEQEEYNWGIQINRQDFANDEKSSWQFIPQNVSGYVSNFADLKGIKGIKPKRQVEIQPYITAGAMTEPKVDNNPFQTGSSETFNAGVDGKIGITTDLTLDFTINPDFGQVEADPSAINLDGFQIFFEERRPFFIENANLFDLGISRFEAGGRHGNDNLFYSRRIGARPNGYVDTPDGSYVDIPDFTSIIGAAKFSGKTKNGWSIGILESMTAQESMKIDTEGDRSSAIVEPRTNYFVSTVRKDLNDGATIISGSLTNVNRNLENTGLEDQYHSSATTGGLDLLHTWKDREWQVRANFFMSNVKGTTDKIKNTQRSFEHYFQRPDADHLNIDEEATSLSGNAGRISLANYGGNDNLSFETGVTWRSAGFELNDIGFLNSADNIDYATWAGYSFPKPFSIFRRFRINVNHYLQMTTDGEQLFHGLNTNWHTGFKNFWQMGLGATRIMQAASVKALFGGPKLQGNPGWNYFFYINSDQRKRFTIGLNANGRTADESKALSRRSFNLWASYQPTSALNISIGPSYTKFKNGLQNVTFDQYNDEDRYVTAQIDQETFSMNLRVNYSITPFLSIQYWGQPFNAIGNYSEYKYITDPGADQFDARYTSYDHMQLMQSENGSYAIDENLDGLNDYSFGSPDFNFLQWRSNLVIRWQYNAASEIFLVWTQGTSNSSDPSKGILDSLSDDLFGGDTRNSFLLKATYRFF